MASPSHSPLGAGSGPERPGPNPTQFTVVHRLAHHGRHVATMRDAMSCGIANILEAKCPCWGCLGMLRDARCEVCHCWWSVDSLTPEQMLSDRLEFLVKHLEGREG